MKLNYHISFLSEFRVKTTVFTSSGNEVGEGFLTIKKNLVPTINFRIDLDLSKFKSHSVFSCQTDKYTYQLIDCDVFENSIIPTFVIRGIKRKYRFKNVNIIFQRLSQWLYEDLSFNITNNESTIAKEKITSIISQRWCEKNQVLPNDQQINEYTVITLKANNYSWSASELRKFINELQTFLTLVIGYPIGLEYLLYSENNDTKNSIYYANTTKELKNEITSNECFIQSSCLLKNNKLQYLLQNYFSLKNDKNRYLWSRISGMLSYEGFWEFKILAYVSLVDRYVCLFTENLKESIPERQFKKLRRSAKDILKTIKNDINDYNEKEILESVIDSMCRQINYKILNTSISTFKEKFELMLASTDKNIIEIIGFEAHDFNHIKKIRDYVAHGDVPNIKYNGDITYEFTTISKIDLLLRYWFFRDIGFSNNDFLHSLDNVLYPITNQARINRTALDISSGKFHFVKTNKTNFHLAKKYKIHCIVFDFVKASSSLKVNISLTEKINLKGNTPIEEYLSDLVDTTIFILIITIITFGYLEGLAFLIAQSSYTMIKGTKVY